MARPIPPVPIHSPHSAHASGWSVDQLKEYLEVLIDAREKALRAAIDAQDRATSIALIASDKATAAALASAERAVAKAEAAAERRFEGVNEFRSALSDQQSTLMPRNEVTAALMAINEKSDGRFTANSEKIVALDKRLDRNEGRGQGVSAVWAFSALFIGILGGLVGIALAIYSAFGH
ncbi:MAG: hypothetical protein QOE70_4028 [Chthoniobacter sp.]|jgi:hypothetical protein|nr:hypothetical protein [Chthoniobacter sp.]